MERHDEEFEVMLVDDKWRVRLLRNTCWQVRFHWIAS